MKRNVLYMITVSAVLLWATVLLAMPASAQHYVGVKGGYGSASGRFYPAYRTAMDWGKYNAGVMWKYYTDQQVVGGVSAELEYQGRGYTLFEGNVTDSTSYISKTRTVNSITMPLIWQPHLYFAKQKVRLFLNAGFTVSYNTGSGDTFTESYHGFDAFGNREVESTTSKYVMQTARDNRWNYGICGGLGLGVLFGRAEVFAEARYYFGMSDILRTKTKYILNEQGTIRSELDNLFVTVGVFFRLGKGGIKERPLGTSSLPPAGGTNFRDIKLEF